MNKTGLSATGSRGGSFDSATECLVRCWGIIKVCKAREPVGTLSCLRCHTSPRKRETHLSGTADGRNPLKPGDQHAGPNRLRCQIVLIGVHAQVAERTISFMF